MKFKPSAAPGFIFFVIALLGWANSALAQQHAGGVSAAELAKANNPLADANAFNFQNYYLTSLYGVPDQTANSLLLRPVIVSGRQIIRITLPVSTVPATPEAKSGFGDLTIFDAIVISPSGATTEYGIGPLLVAPIASDDALGQGKWQAGAAAVLVRPLAGASMFAALVRWQTDFAGDDNRTDTNFLTAQPIGILQVGAGYYVRSSSVWTFDFENERYLIPFGVGAGKVFRVGRTVINAFLEPQFSAYHKGSGQPALQLFSGINLQWFKQK